jgi:uncharacterized protein
VISTPTFAHRTARLLNRLGAWLLLLPIRFYRRYITPMTPATCRYYPSCATYADEAIRLHGPIRGSWLAARRLARCHPWTPGGVDHVPGSPRALATPDSTPSSTVTGA